MTLDMNAAELGMMLVQLLGLLGLCLGRMSLRSAYAGWLQSGYFACMVVVAAVLLLGVGVLSPWWIITGTTFATMVVGAAWPGPGVG